MHVLLVGNGGREAALAWRMSRSPSLTQLTTTGDNPGWPTNVCVRLAQGVSEIVALAQQLAVDLVVCGPEAPAAEGLQDALGAVGIPMFGPSRAAARLESSKAFCKEIAQEAGVATARALVVDADDPASMERAMERCAEGNVVVKADGLAAGKGVIVCETAEQARVALEQVQAYGARILLEDRMVGPEVSVFALCDGEHAVGLPSAQDHKQLLDGGRGPNTGGMGAFAPCALLDDAQVQDIVATFHQPVLDVMRRRGMPFRGVLYAGLMMTDEGPKLLEFNVRFGDPECQPLMVLWDDDILPWLDGAARGRLPAGRPAFRQGSACCVVLASAGYPASSTKGVAIPQGDVPPNVEIFHAGTRRDETGTLRTNGGRVLGVTAYASDQPSAREDAYRALKEWCFEGAQFRTDVAKAP